MCPPRLGGNRSGIDPSHLEDVLEQPGEAFDFGQNLLALLQPIVRRQCGCLNIGRRHANGREGGAQVVSQ